LPVLYTFRKHLSYRYEDVPEDTIYAINYFIRSASGYENQTFEFEVNSDTTPDPVDPLIDSLTEEERIKHEYGQIVNQINRKEEISAQVPGYSKDLVTSRDANPLEVMPSRYDEERTRSQRIPRCRQVLIDISYEIC